MGECEINILCTPKAREITAYIEGSKYILYTNVIIKNSAYHCLVFGNLQTGHFVMPRNPFHQSVKEMKLIIPWPLSHQSMNEASNLRNQKTRCLQTKVSVGLHLYSDNWGLQSPLPHIQHH